MGHSSTEQINMSIYFIGLGKKGLKTKGISGAKTRRALARVLYKWNGTSPKSWNMQLRFGRHIFDIMENLFLRSSEEYVPIGSYCSYRLLKLFSVFIQRNTVSYQCANDESVGLSLGPLARDAALVSVKVNSKNTRSVKK